MSEEPKFGVFVDVYKSKANGQWRWRALDAGNYRQLANSGESYHNKQDCLDAVAQLFGDSTIQVRIK
jgi:uncharacterized protein YegP (UPF0339 family)